jgi:hypothetical protein
MTPLLVQETLGFVKDPKIEKDTQPALAEAYGKTLNKFYCSCSGTSMATAIVTSCLAILR